MTKNSNELDEKILRPTAAYPSVSTLDENEETDHSQQIDRELAVLEKRYERRLSRIDEEEKSALVRLVSEIIGSPGEIELKRLILENRLPIMVVTDEDWVTDWFDDDLFHPVYDLLFEAKKHLMTFDPNFSDAPGYYLREAVAGSVRKQIMRLQQLQEQLVREGEFSRIIDDKIYRLSKLNNEIRFSKKESSKILN